jgi:hypothetical protein
MTRPGGLQGRATENLDYGRVSVGTAAGAVRRPSAGRAAKRVGARAFPRWAFLPPHIFPPRSSHSFSS